MLRLKRAYCLFVFSLTELFFVRQNLRFLFYCLFLLCSQRCSAQRFPFFNLKVENGLAQSQSTCLSQDSFGNLWIGTLGGLSRYDGKKITNYTVSDGLLSNTIIDLLFATSGRLYISTQAGVQLFDGGKFSTLTDHKNEKIIGVSQIMETAPGHIYFLKHEKLYVLHIREDKVYPVLSEEDFTAMYYKNGVIRLAGTKGVLYTFVENTFPLKKDSAFCKDTSLVVLKIFEDSRQHCWLLCNKGLYLKEGNQIKPYKLKGRQAIPIPLLGAAEDRNGQVWFASYRGAFRMKDTVISYFNQQNGLSDNIIYATLCDREGNIWFSSDGEGLFRYSGGPFISIDENFGLPNKQVTCITGDEKGVIYFSSYQGKLSQYNVATGIKIIEAPELRNDIISGVLWQTNKGLWIGTRNSGLFIWKKEEVKKFNTEQFGKEGRYITSLYKDGKENLFVGFAKNMLRIDGAVGTYIQIGDAQANCFASIGEDSLLIATSKGFYLYHNNISSPWKNQEIPDSITVQCMVFSNQTLFIGTSEKGIIAYHLSDKSYTTLNVRKGLSSDFIYNIIKDKEGNIWAGTGMGICKITPQDNQEYKIKVFGKANGIIGLECNSNAVFEEQSGHIWFGTTEGVSCYFPSAKPTTPQPGNIVLEAVTLFGGRNIDSSFFAGTSGWYAIPQQLKLPYRFNNLSFSFQAVTLSPVDKIFYSYLLEGSGINWSEWSEENTINFSALEPANYTLKVKCKINGIVQQQALLVYSFTIKTPFHKSIWFVISILGLAILSGVYLQYTTHKRKIKRQQREDGLRKEEQNRVRERTAEDFHDEIGNRLTRINVLTSVLKSKLTTPTADTDRLIQQIQDNSLQLYAGTKDILWSLQPSNDNLFEVLNHVRDLAIEMFSETNISFFMSGNDERFRDYKMPLDKSRNFIMIWKEALNNCIKYAGANNVLLQVQRTNDKMIQVRLTDDGKGFNRAAVPQGNGLKNMKSRADRMEATIEILSAESKGTQIILNLNEVK